MISTVVNSYDLYDNKCGVVVTYDDDTEVFVPLDEANRHYKEVLAWIDEGNEIGEPE